MAGRLRVSTDLEAGNSPSKRLLLMSQRRLSPHDVLRTRRQVVGNML
jgi:hypothetical protein